jgi:hypothetical protein
MWILFTYDFRNMKAHNVEHLRHHGTVHEGVQGVDVQGWNVVHLLTRIMYTGTVLTDFTLYMPHRSTAFQKSLFTNYPA